MGELEDINRFFFCLTNVLVIFFTYISPENYDGYFVRYNFFTCHESRIPPLSFFTLFSLYAISTL